MDFQITGIDNINLIGKDDFENNPWSVGDASVFLKYCCPECDYQILNYDMFSYHALENHVKSKVLFEPNEGKEGWKVKPEVFNYEINHDSYFDDQEMETKELPEYQRDKKFSMSKENILLATSSSETLLYCEFCDFTCTSNDELFNHCTNQHESKPPPLYRCNVCEFVHKDRTYVEIHSVKMHRKHFYCGTCGKILEKSETLQSHCTKSNQCTVFDISVCTLCDMVFSNREFLNKHNLAVHKADKGDSKELPHCDLCDFKCSTKKTLKAKKELNDHISQEHQKGKMKCCPYCDFKRATLDKIRYHIDKKHPNHGDKKYFCDICTKGFIFEASCKSHNLLIHQKQFICEICKCVSKCKRDLAEHLAKMHNQEMEKYKCDLCFINLPSKFKLKQHRLQKHQSGLKDKRCSCSYCDYTAHNWNTLKIHIEGKHPEHGEKKHFCDVCGEGFIFEENFHFHKKNKHEKNVCNICGLALSKNSSMSDHMISIHKVKGSQKFVCEICAFSTFSKPLLKNHKRMHDEQKNLKCPHCDYKTHDKSRVHVHIDSKHPDQYAKKFDCSHCSRKFIFEDSLKKHMQNQKTMAKNRAKKISL